MLQVNTNPQHFTILLWTTCRHTVWTTCRHTVKHRTTVIKLLTVYDLVLLLLINTHVEFCNSMDK